MLLARAAKLSMQLSNILIAILCTSIDKSIMNEVTAAHDKYRVGPARNNFQTAYFLFEKTA